MGSVPRSDSGITTALIYTRVSSDEQAHEGLSLDTQLAVCRRYAAERGWVLGNEYQDVLTGTRDDRPDYQALLADVRRLRADGSGAAVVVLRLDRLGRRVLERVRSREELKALGVPTHSVREGGEVSDLVANILASVAEEEVRRLGERVRDSLAHMTERGWAKPGFPAFGYCWRPATHEERALGAPKSVLVIDPETAHVVRETFDRADRGVSLRALSRWLASLPFEVRAGRAWSYTAIRHMLTSPTYIGRLRNGRPGRWEALIDEAQFARVGARLDRHQHMPRQASGRYLLTGLLRCPQCGGRMSGRLGSWDTRPRDSGQIGGRLPRRYTCYAASLGAAPKPVKCRFAVNAPKLEAQALAQVGSLLDALGLGNGDTGPSHALRNAWRSLEQPATDYALYRSLEQAATKARERIKRLALLFADGDLDREGYELGRQQAQTDLQAAEEALAGLSDQQVDLALPPLEEALAGLGGWAGALEGGGVAAQRDVFGLLIERLEIARLSFGRFELRIIWSPVGQALAKLRQRGGEAA